MTYKILTLNQYPCLKEQTAQWFHEKWGIPYDTYLESINTSIENNSAVPKWYVVMEGSRIICGAGVIDNDFHKRKDLSPNICALYTEEDKRGNKIAGNLLTYICNDMKSNGISTLYLVTDHTSFYEKYGWEFLCMVREENSCEHIRMYVHKT